MKKFLQSSVTLLVVTLILGQGANAWADDDEADSFDILGRFPTPELAQRIKAYQFRGSFLYGDMFFSSKRPDVGSQIALNGVLAGARAELETWFKTGRENRRDWGLLTDLQYLYVGRFKALPGPPIYYFSGSIMAGWRVLGAGHTVPWAPELTLMLGPSAEVFPAASLYTNLAGSYSDYSLDHPVVLGAKPGARLRFPLFTRMLAVETTGYVILPVTVVGVPGGAGLAREDTKSMGATALVDLRIAPNLVLGGGIYWSYFRLNYRAAGNPASDETIFRTHSYIGSLRFAF